MNHRPTVTIEPDEFGRTLMSEDAAIKRAAQRAKQRREAS